MSPKTVLSSLLNDEDSQDSINENPTIKVHTMECDAHANGLDLTLDDVRFLVELFYLPYEHGPNVQQIFLNFHWLRFNYHSQQGVSKADSMSVSLLIASHVSVKRMAWSSIRVP
jgi:hypothetical protein